MKYFLFLLLSLVLSCKQESENPVTCGFFYWKTTFSLQKKELQFVANNHVIQLNIRLADLTWNKQLKKAELSNVISIRDSVQKQIRLVPVIYIVNEVFNKIKPNELEHIANNCLEALESKFRKYPINEYQIDCDWTPSTQHVYFSFLEYLKTHSNKKISCTIRLHQIKFHEKTGIPPVSTGVLMCYNLENPSSNRVNNSIFDLKTAKSYLDEFEKYPINCQLALPIFYWAVQFRNKKFVRLINLEPDFFESNVNMINVGKNIFRVKRNSYIGTVFLRENDILRFEFVAKEELNKLVKFLMPKLTNKTILYYHLDSKNLTHYEALIRSNHSIAIH